jgi:hypothetical protein
MHKIVLAFLLLSVATAFEMIQRPLTAEYCDFVLESHRDTTSVPNNPSWPLYDLYVLLEHLLTLEKNACLGWNVSKKM